MGFLYFIVFSFFQKETVQKNKLPTKKTFRNNGCLLSSSRSKGQDCPRPSLRPHLPLQEHLRNRQRHQGYAPPQGSTILPPSPRQDSLRSLQALQPQGRPHRPS